jgi:hypothetical protein
MPSRISSSIVVLVWGAMTFSAWNAIVGMSARPSVIAPIHAATAVGSTPATIGGACSAGTAARADAMQPTSWKA